jgi:hypothetical protein
MLATREVFRSGPSFPRLDGPYGPPSRERDALIARADTGGKLRDVAADDLAAVVEAAVKLVNPVWARRRPGRGRGRAGPLRQAAIHAGLARECRGVVRYRS